MSKSSFGVKRWRSRTKMRAVEAMGGKCSTCGYDKFYGSLEFHHLDPNEKDFGISNCNTRAWASIVVELKKCILVCSNCHKEIHAGIREIPKDYPKFDDRYLDYAKNFPVEIKHRKIDWSEIDLLEELRYSSLQQIADRMDISKGAVYKRQQKLLAGTLVASEDTVNVP